jgi:hypothetical protein
MVVVAAAVVGERNTERETQVYFQELDDNEDDHDANPFFFLCILFLLSTPNPPPSSLGVGGG